MADRSAYAYDYEMGSTAPKREYQAEPKKNKSNVKRRYGKNKVNKATKQVTKKRFSTVAIILCTFSMVMVLTYRYNLISEKNLESQELKKQLDTADSALLNAKIDVEQQTDLNKIEAYAKQQLGMQKPDKNQTIYVDTSNTMQTVETNSENSFLDNIVNAIKNFINNIF
ncbi:MAG: cell division protein FtsL [Clostridia bacterium]|nr:cell division protein FtsL [Clostridia bacterium]